MFPYGGNLCFIQTAIIWNLDAKGRMLPETGADPIEATLDNNGLPIIGIYPDTIPQMGVPGPSLFS